MFDICVNMVGICVVLGMWFLLLLRVYEFLRLVILYFGLGFVVVAGVFTCFVFGR